MKNLLEKIKDILYDGIDYILMIGIAVAIALTINWKLDGLFAISTIDELQAQSLETVEESTEDEEAVDNEEVASDEEKETEEASNDEDGDKPVASQEKSEEKEEENKEEDKEEDVEVAQETGTQESDKSNETVTINIPAGSLPPDIGNILTSEGLVESKDAFLKKVKETGTEKKLRDGEFEISRSSSIDDIINILAR